MDPLRIHAYKTRSIKKHKGHQWLNEFILYSLTTLACTSFCSSPFCYPPFCATFNVFFFFSLPKITSFFFTSKALFIVGNLIVIFLLGESKFFAYKSKSYNDICQGKYECKSLDQLQLVSTSQEQKGKPITREISQQVNTFKTNNCEQNDEDEFFESCDNEAIDENIGSSSHEEVLTCPKREVMIQGDVEAEELNKLVDDFIAKVIRQRRLEAEFCRG